MPTQSALPIAQFSPSDLIFISDTNELVTDSLTVSKHFSKQHKDVLKRLNLLIVQMFLRQRTFAPTRKKSQQALLLGTLKFTK
ncbi:hypothetical protein UB38_13510 [Photobacterium iliopiscarium]|nr:hypothetical protein UB38_13510 [Photobacterium iliopiscarium]